MLDGIEPRKEPTDFFYKYFRMKIQNGYLEKNSESSIYCDVIAE